MQRAKACRPAEAAWGPAVACRDVLEEGDGLLEAGSGPLGGKAVPPDLTGRVIGRADRIPAHAR